jgi:hypothetical protein
VAVRRYAGLPLPDIEAWDYAEELRQGGQDIPGVCGIKARSRPGDDLGVCAKDFGWQVLVLGHEAPVMWLVGWATAEDVKTRGKMVLNASGDPRWYLSQSELIPLQERP